MKNISSLFFLLLLLLFLVSTGNESTPVSGTTEIKTPAAETEKPDDGQTPAEDIENDEETMQIVLGF